MPEGIKLCTPAEDEYSEMEFQSLTVSQYGSLFFFEKRLRRRYIKIYKEVYHFMAKVELKQPIVEEISNVVKDAQAVVLVNYSGLTVEQDTIMRKELRESGIQYKVYKNTMMHRAFEGTEFEALIKHLNGTNALAVSADDATAPARIIAKYAKQYPKLEMVAGVIEGGYNDAKGMEALANIPSRDELLAKLFGSLQSPITNLARVLNQIAEKGGAGACEAAPAAEEAPAAEAPAAE